MSFAWPWCFLALPLPLLLHWWSRRGGHELALRVPSLPTLPPSTVMHSLPASSWLALLVWLLLVGAAARPQTIETERLLPVSGRDLLLAFDVSASMAMRDLSLDGQPLTRLAAARHYAAEFLRQRQGDRVGLIVFGTQAYLHTPPSFDLEAVGSALSTAELGLAGRETALGDAIALAAKHLPGQQRVLVLLTDGVNTAGTLTLQKAAWLARREGVRIHAVRIGGAESGRTDAEDDLNTIAQRSGGTYLRATDSAATARFWQQLNEIEPIGQGATSRDVPHELYPAPLAAALALACTFMLYRRREGST